MPHTMYGASENRRKRTLTSVSLIDTIEEGKSKKAKRRNTRESRFRDYDYDRDTRRESIKGISVKPQNTLSPYILSQVSINSSRDRMGETRRRNPDHKGPVVGDREYQNLEKKCKHPPRGRTGHRRYVK